MKLRWSSSFFGLLDWDDLLVGLLLRRPLRFGTANAIGSESSKNLGFKRSTETFSSLSPTCSLKNLSPGWITRKGPSYGFCRGFRCISRLTKMNFAVLRFLGNDDLF